MAKCVSVTIMTLVTPKVQLSMNFRCDQIYKYQRYDFGHTLLCCLSLTWMFNKLPSTSDFSLTLLSYLSLTWMFNNPTYEHLNVHPDREHSVKCHDYWLKVILPNDSLSKWQFVKMTICQNDNLSKWQFVKMTICQNDNLSKWQFVKMTIIQKTFF